MTWGSGATGIAGAVSDVNSLTGSSDGDMVGSAGMVELTYLPLNIRQSISTGAAS